MLNSLKNRSVFVESYGCTTSKADGTAVETYLGSIGCNMVSYEEAEVFIIMTCTVTRRTELNMLKRIKEASIDKHVVVAGCLPSAQPELLKDLNVKTLTIAKANLELEGFQKRPIRGQEVIKEIKISDGCLGNCS